jgi:hypothetical protein
MKWTTAGLPHEASASSIRPATSSAGGLETATITFVGGSAASAAMPCRNVRPSTADDRSRPPVPIASLTPSPARERTTLTSWMPVPAAPTMPIAPRRTSLAKHSGTPPRIAVPHPGPISSFPRETESRLSSTSSSSVTLSENSSTCRPRPSALRASSAAWAPGSEINARLASGSAPSAPVQPSARDSPPPDAAARRGLSSSSSLASAVSRAASSTASMAATRSLGPAPARFSVQPRSARRCRLNGVAMAMIASPTPGWPFSAALTCISFTESWYESLRSTQRLIFARSPALPPATPVRGTASA